MALSLPAGSHGGWTPCVVRGASLDLNIWLCRGAPSSVVVYRTANVPHPQLSQHSPSPTCGLPRTLCCSCPACTGGAALIAECLLCYLISVCPASILRMCRLSAMPIMVSADRAKLVKREEEFPFSLQCFRCSALWDRAGLTPPAAALVMASSSGSWCDGGRDSHGESQEEVTGGGASAFPCVISGDGAALWSLFCR